MELVVKSYFDDETGEEVVTRYFVDGEEISEDEYLDTFEEYEDCVEDCEFDCEECPYDEDVEIEEILEEYHEMIMDTEGCPQCIYNLLADLFEEAYELGYIASLEDQEEL